MQPVLDLYLLVDKYAALLPKLNGEAKDEYSTMLLQLQNQVEGGTPKNETYVDQCLTWLARYNSQPQAKVA
jgi:hypothetical protein